MSKVTVSGPFPLPITQKALRDHFIPIVQTAIEGTSIENKISVRYIEDMPISGGMMFYVTIELCGSPHISELSDMLENLAVFTNYEGVPAFEAGGRFWYIGDGDDAGAVFFEHGKLNIWLRGWTQPQ